MKLESEVVKPIKMCWWKIVAINDYLKATTTNREISLIDNYGGWKKCFYCGESRLIHCKEYVVRNNNGI